MTGRDLYAHLRDDGAGSAFGAALAIIAGVLVVSVLVRLWERRKARRIADEQGIEVYPPDRVEQVVRDALAYEADHQMLLREDGDGLTRDWTWR